MIPELSVGKEAFKHKGLNIGDLSRRDSVYLSYTFKDGTVLE